MFTKLINYHIMYQYLKRNFYNYYVQKKDMLP